MKPTVNQFYDKYFHNYSMVIKAIEENQLYYRGVNLLLCDKKSLFEEFNYRDQFGKEWPYKPVEPKEHPLKRLFPNKIEHISGSSEGREIKTLIWKRQSYGWKPGSLNYKPGDMIFSSSKAPRLYFQSVMDGVNFYQFKAIDLKEQIDNFHGMFERFKALDEIILDEDISPDKNALCQVAAQFGAKSTLICHGQLGIITGFLPLTADFMQVKYAEQRDKLIRWGLESNRIIVKYK